MGERHTQEKNVVASDHLLHERWRTQLWEELSPGKEAGLEIGKIR